MRPLKSEIKIEIYENNGKESEIGKTDYMSVLSHWNRGELVILIFNNQSVTVRRGDLDEAIQRCSY